MKTLRLSCFLSLFLLPAILFAQGEMSNGFLFPKFVEGQVLFKDGKSVNATLNYSCFNHEMLFMDPSNDNKIMAVANPLTISTIIIEGRYFVYSGKNAFYEEVKAGESYFYIQWVLKQISAGKASAYGGYSGTSAVTSYGHVNGASGEYNGLNLDEKFETVSENVYYLKINNKFKRFTSAVTLGKLFKGRQAEIDAFVTEQKIDFKKPSDVGKVVEFCAKFTK